MATFQIIFSKGLPYRLVEPLDGKPSLLSVLRDLCEVGDEAGHRLPHCSKRRILKEGIKCRLLIGFFPTRD
jgi:hypothetical protein